MPVFHFSQFSTSRKILYPALVGLLSLASTPLAAHTISSNFECAWYGVDIAGPKSLRGALSIEEKVLRVAAKLPVVKGEDGTTIYPSGTTIDRAEVSDGWLSVWVTFPAEVQEKSLDPNQIYQGGEVLRHYFADSEKLQGNKIFARSTAQQDYKDLEAFILHEAPADIDLATPAALDYEVNGPGPQPDPDYEAWYDQLERESSTTRDMSGQSPSLGGSGMPSGSLAGRIIFTYGGHGRTWDGDAATPTWRWQRGYWNNMLEDYGNVDGSDAYAYHCFNAGATVVSFRPIGYQNNEVVIDNTSPGFSTTGSWINSSNTRYYGSGTPYVFADTANTETATATYTPAITEAGHYPVYTWVNHGSDRVPGQLYRIKTTGGEAQMRIDHRRVGCGWVYLGTYYFNAGSNAATGSVTISNLNPPSVPAGSYIAVADAIRFGNGMGDVNNSGGVSGWSRREESTVYWIQNGWGNGTSPAEQGVNSYTAAQVWNNANTSDDESLSWNAPPRMAAQMYRLHSDTTAADKRYALYLGWHSNGSNGSARGSMGLITGGPTTNQAWWADRVADQLDAASLEEAVNWEHPWVNRSNTYTGGYSEISNSNFQSKMDATIIEVAYHDNVQDAALMRDPKVRNVHGRGTYRAAVQYFNNFRGGPLAYFPEAPVRFRAVNSGNGSATLGWQPGPTGGTKGQAATSYRVYQSPDGLGWGGGQDVAGTAHTVSGLTVGEIYYFRVAGLNAGGESFPSDTLAVRVTPSGSAEVLVVNGFDRLDRFNNIVRGGHSGVVEQLIPQQNNTYNYVRQHGSAIAAAGRNFDSTTNEAVINGDINLNSYQTVVWILGEESSKDNTFNTTERTKVDAFLAAGNSLFVSGAELGYELDFLNVGRTFYRSTLNTQFALNSAGSFMANGSPGSIFAGISNIDYAPTSNMYNVDSPDVITPLNGAMAALAYAPASPISDSFDSIGSWQTPGFSGSTTADSSTFGIVSSPKREGSGAADLNYNWSLGTILREHNTGGATFPNNATFSIWVHGDNSGDTLSMFLRDTADNELFQNAPIVIDFNGWRQIVWNLASDPKTRFAGAGDNVFTGNVRLDSLYLTKTGTSPSGHLYFDEASYSTGAGGSPGTAAVQYSGTYKLVHLAFPFEAINSQTQRNQLMQNAMNFLSGTTSAVGDWSIY